MLCDRSSLQPINSTIKNFESIIFVLLRNRNHDTNFKFRSNRNETMKMGIFHQFGTIDLLHSKWWFHMLIWHSIDLVKYQFEWTTLFFYSSSETHIYSTWFRIRFEAANEDRCAHYTIHARFHMYIEWNAHQYTSLLVKHQRPSHQLVACLLLNSFRLVLWFCFVRVHFVAGLQKPSFSHQ